MAMGMHWNPQKETIQETVTLIDSIRLEIKELRQLNSTSKHCLVESARESGQGQSSAYKMFDGMRSKNDVFFPSEIPEIQSTGLNEDVTRFNLGSQIDNQVNERTLLVKIHHEVFPISCRELDMVFSRCGILEKLEKFSTENEFHSMVCFQNKESALEAFNSFNGRNIYDEGCEMELILGSTLAKERRVSNEAYSSDEVSMGRGFQQTVTQIYPTQQVQALSQQQLQDSHSYSEDHQAPIEFLNGSSKDSFKMSGMATHRSQETNVNSKAKANLASAAQPRGKFEKWCEKETGMDQNKEVIPSASSTDVVQASQICQEHDLSVEKSREIGTIFRSGLNLKVPSAMMNLEQENLKVIPFPDFAKVVASNVVAIEKMGGLVDESFESSALSWDEFKVKSVEFLANSGACNMFDDMPTREFITLDSSVQLNNVHARKNWNFDPGGSGTENLNFVALADSLGFEKPDLCPILIDDSVSPKELLVIAQELFGALSKKEIVWVETLLNLHAEFSVDLPSFGSIDSSSSFIFDPGGCFRKVLFGSSKNVDKKVLVQWFTQLSYAFGGFTCDKFIMKLCWGKVQLSNGNEGGSKCNMEDEVFLMPSDCFVYGLTLHYSGEAATLEDGFANTRFLWDPGDHWLLLSTHCCWVLGGLIYVFDPGGDFLNFVLASVNLCCFPFDPGGIGCP